MYFQSFEPLVRTLAVGIPAYVILILFLRVSGKRTLSKMNAFDLVVTVALGSTLANILLSPDVALAEGVLALGLLIFLQLIITWTSVRVPAVQRLVKATPRLLSFRGELLPAAMRAERVTEEEVEASVRESGLAGVAAAYAVVLETDGTLTVLPRQEGGGGYTTLRHVKGPRKE